MPAGEALALAFQSTPAITDERALMSGSFRTDASGFNPRPPLLASEPVRSVSVDAAWPVSIHPRHYWRASPELPIQRRAGQGVSIHARHYWRASPSVWIGCWSCRGFQSTPAITGERAGCFTAHPPPMYGFNPRPPLLASEPRDLRHAPHGGHVSIHARHYWRASRMPSPAARPETSFQSTPAITGERAQRPVVLDPPLGVSIHARHYWRASRQHIGRLHIVQVVSIHARHYWRASLGAVVPHAVAGRFNPRPPLLASEPAGRPRDRVTTEFQSTPAITGERAARCRAVGPPSRCFNPRPPLLASEPGLWWGP